MKTLTILSGKGGTGKTTLSASLAVLLSKKSILYPTISHDQKNIAFLEVTSLKGQYFDNLWVSNINNGSSVKLYAGPARAKTGELAWSFDDRSIGMFFSPEAGIVEIQTPEIFHRLSGADFNWSENKKVIFSQGNNIYFYDLNTKKRQIFSEQFFDVLLNLGDEWKV